MQDRKKRIVILGGGFGGVYTAMRLEKLLKGRDDVEVILVNRENYFVFQPMLAEVVSGSIGILDTVSPIRRLLPRTDLYVRDVVSIDLERKAVTLGPGFWPRSHILAYDHLVLALGSVTDFREMPGLHEHALPFKNLADAICLRNHLIRVLEEADNESDPKLRRELLTFVVAGGGYSGVEVVAELNDFVRKAAATYRDVNPDEIEVILVHSGERILERELGKELSGYAQDLLFKRGVDIRLKTRLKTASPDAAIVDSGERIPTKTLISTVPSSPNPVVDALLVPKEKGRVKVSPRLEVEGCSGVWAVGDCALVPNPGGEGYVPPTAQHAVREGEMVAHNIVAALDGAPMKTYAFKGMGTMGSLGYHSAVAELFGRFKLSGFIAWFLWRSVYWWKLPGADRKLKVGIDWFLNLLVQPELVQLHLGLSQGVVHAHYEPGDVVYRQGDLGDCLYIIMKGQVEVVHKEQEGEKEHVLACLGPGEYFGEMALLNQRAREATVRCQEPLDVLSLKKGDFTALVASLPELRESLEHVMAKRNEQNLKG
jgi:NADH:quinone reductase (non-electrogenic)